MDYKKLTGLKNDDRSGSEPKSRKSSSSFSDYNDYKNDKYERGR
jgi:hypothetical protein